MKFSIALIFILSVGFSSCLPTRSLRHFTLYGETKKVDPKKFKINGIYFSVIPRACNRFWYSDLIKCFIFYENGFFFSIEHSGLDTLDMEASLNQYLEILDKLGFKGGFKGDVRYWGSYFIDDNKLLTQKYDTDAFRWVLGPILRAKIINNTTIEFDEGFCFNNEEVSKRFTLVETKSKPDSVNIFMTNKRIKRKLDRLYKERHTR